MITYSKVISIFFSHTTTELKSLPFPSHGDDQLVNYEYLIYLATAKAVAAPPSTSGAMTDRVAHFRGLRKPSSCFRITYIFCKISSY